MKKWFKYKKNCDETEKNLENLNKNIAFVGINCNNAVNSFQQIALTKFVEIDIEELPKENNKITEDKNRNCS